MEKQPHSATPDFATLAAEAEPSPFSSVPRTDCADDPEIAALLDFDPAPRKVDRPDGWTPELQRELVARIAALGSPGEACKAMDKNLSGAKHLYRTDGADSFRDAWKAAIALAAARKRAARSATPPPPVHVPGTVSRTPAPADTPDPLAVICDSCRQAGLAGEDKFSAIPDLMDFDPVPRPGHDRLWPAETQRAFIAALAVSGSVERAARSVTRHAFGAEKLRKARGARSFNEAWDAALDLARERELTRLHGTLDDLASQPPEEEVDEARDGGPGGYGEDDIDDVRERILAKLERMSRRMLREKIIPFPEKRAAWVELNGAEEIDALTQDVRGTSEDEHVEAGTWKAEELGERPETGCDEE